MLRDDSKITTAAYCDHNKCKVVCSSCNESKMTDGVFQESKTQKQANGKLTSQVQQFLLQDSVVVVVVVVVVAAAEARVAASTGFARAICTRSIKNRKQPRIDFLATVVPTNVYRRHHASAGKLSGFPGSISSFPTIKGRHSRQKIKARNTAEPARHVPFLYLFCVSVSAVGGMERKKHSFRLDDTALITLVKKGSILNCFMSLPKRKPWSNDWGAR
jgi:hypothetical protein